MKKVKKAKKHSCYIKLILLVIVGAFVFQFWHFVEHFAQVGMWILGFQHAPYMTPIGMWAMDWVGVTFFPNASFANQKYFGFEMLHLLGNAIFMVGIICLSLFVRTKKVIWALAVQGFHVYEHISLTLSAIFIGKSIGISTFFGMAVDPWMMVCYRVWWHFIFNLVPSVLVVLVLMELYKAFKKKKGTHNLVKIVEKLKFKKI